MPTPCRLGAQKFDGSRRLMRRQVVGDDALARPQRRGELALDVSIKAVAVHRTVQDPGCDQAVMAKACNKGLGVPVAEGRMVDEALADGCPAGVLDEVGLQARLVDEDQHFQHVGHVGLACLNPDPAPLGDVWPQDFAGEQRFFMAEAKPVQPFADRAAMHRHAMRAGQTHVTLEIVRRAPWMKGFVVIRRRWVVERTFAWIMKCRRLARDYEQRASVAETLIMIAASATLIRRWP